MIALDPNKTVFVDVDTQVDFVEPSGALYVPGAETLKHHFRALVEAARAMGAPVVASADAHPPDDPEFAQFPPHCLRGTAGQRRVPETEPERALVIAVDGTPGGDPVDGATTVLEKVHFDLFTNPAAEQVLVASGADTAVVFGVALDYCVRAAALGLRQRGYRTLLVTDATVPVTAEGGERTLSELTAAGVELVRTADLAR